eukprot:jgi/Chlat1/4553/Chrsp29S08897
MDKVNMSVAIIPISHQFHWSASTAGLVQSSFFWGYALSQLPGGWLASSYSGRNVLRAGVLAWSLATGMVPLVVTAIPLLCLSRVLVGLGEGVSPPSAIDIIAKSVPNSERSRATTATFSGLNVGSVVGLLIAPACIELFGWESVFYGFAFLGIAWSLAWDWMVGPENLETQSTVGRVGNLVPDKAAGKILAIGFQTTGSGEQAAPEVEKPPPPHQVPWRNILKEPAVWAMVTAHFCGNWGHFVLLSWLPTYFTEELHLDLTGAALYSILPPLGSVCMATVAASIADGLIARGTDTTKVRKLCQTIAFVAPATCMAIAAYAPDLSPMTVVGVLTTGVAFSSFALAGLFCTHQDISPKYASILVGLTNTAGALPGVVGVAFTGYMLDKTHSWTLALFLPCITCYAIGTLVWNLFASSEPQTFGEE